MALHGLLPLKAGGTILICRTVTYGKESIFIHQPGLESTCSCLAHQRQLTATFPQQVSNTGGCSSVAGACRGAAYESLIHMWQT